MLVTPDNGVVLQWRSSTGAECGNVTVDGIDAPVWVKLTRSGNSFAGYYSTDGVTWTQVGTTKSITLPTKLQAGLAVTAHDNTALATAVFTNVVVEAGFTTKLAETGWVATASSTLSGSSAANALDGNKATVWSTATHQTPGQWFEVDLGSAQTFQQLILDSSSSPNNYLRGYAIYVSNNGTSWSKQPIVTGKGTSAVTTITLPEAVTARYVRVVQTGQNPTWKWSIDEFSLYS
jgi:hypothetical protein